MERYSRKCKTKWQNHYSEEFKRHVCNEFITGTLPRRVVERKFEIGNSRLDCWLKELGYEFSKPRLVSLPIMSESPSTNSQNKDSKDSIDKLKKELEDAKLLAETYRKMIEISEQELKINIRKKSNTR